MRGYGASMASGGDSQPKLFSRIDLSCFGQIGRIGYFIFGPDSGQIRHLFIWWHFSVGLASGSISMRRRPVRRLASPLCGQSVIGYRRVDLIISLLTLFYPSSQFNVIVRGIIITKSVLRKSNRHLAVTLPDLCLCRFTRICLRQLFVASITRHAPLAYGQVQAAGPCGQQLPLETLEPPSNRFKNDDFEASN